MLAKVIDKEEQTETKSITFYIKGGEKVSRMLVFRDIIIEVSDFQNNKHILKCKLLDNFLETETGNLHPYDQRALYIDFKERVKKEKIKPKTDQFKEAIRKDPYFNAVQAKYGYAITCHKAQGGEWSEVFVDFKVFMGFLSLSFFRWAYTAITRAKSYLYSIDAPDYSPLSEFTVKPIELLPRVTKDAFYYPNQEIKISDSPNFERFPFLKWRFQRIKKIMDEQEIMIRLSQDNWVEKYTFRIEDKKTAIYLWYNSNFFNTKYLVHEENDKEFTHLIIRLLNKVLWDNNVPFNPKFDFQTELFSYLKEFFRELKMDITNIKLEKWSDKYFFSTGLSFGTLEFWHNKKGVYTKVIPRSTLGMDDEKLKMFVQQLKGDQIHVV